MNRLFEMHEEFKAKPLPTEVRAAWLHHRYVQIHPFQDGNGRTGRLLIQSREKHGLAGRMEISWASGPSVTHPRGFGVSTAR